MDAGREANRVLEVASRHTSQLLATMSDDRRTPLDAVIGDSAMLQEDTIGLGEAGAPTASYDSGR